MVARRRDSLANINAQEKARRISPPGSYTARCRLLDRDLARLRLHDLLLRQVDQHDAVLALRADARLVDVVRQRETTSERAVEALDTVHLFIVGALLLLALAGQRQHAILQRDV